MEVFFVLILLLALSWAIHRILFGSTTNQEAANISSPPPLTSVPAPRLFDLYRDARGSSTLFGFPVVFSSKLDSGKYPNIVTGLTLNLDYIAVYRGSYGVKALLLNDTLSICIMKGCPPGFRENSEYMMQLESESDVVRFPISFSGWLQIVDAGRRHGSAIEVDSDLPPALRALIECPLPGDEVIKPMPTKAIGSKKDFQREKARCGSCGATIGRRSLCDYCGLHQT